MLRGVIYALYKNINNFSKSYWCGVSWCCVINIDAAALKVLPFDKSLKSGQVVVLLVYESY